MLFHFGEVHLGWIDNHIPKRIDLKVHMITFMAKCGCFFSNHARSDPFFTEFEIVCLVFVVELMGNIDLFCANLTLKRRVDSLS